MGALPLPGPDGFPVLLGQFGFGFEPGLAGLLVDGAGLELLINYNLNLLFTYSKSFSVTAIFRKNSQILSENSIQHNVG